MKKIVILTIFLSAFCLAAKGAFTIASKNDQSIILEFSPDVIEWETVQVGMDQYVKPVYTVLFHEPGKPGVPIFSYSLNIPQRKIARITVLDSVFKILPSQELLPSPSLKFSPKSDLYETTFDKNKVYEIDAYFPATCVSSTISIFRHQKKIDFAVYPVQYNPIQRHIKSLQYLRIKIDFEPEPVFLKKIDSFQQKSYANAVKLFIHDEGVYKITGRMLSDAGFDLSAISSQNTAISSMGKSVPFEIVSENPGQFAMEDALYFYAKRLSGENEYHHAYSDTNVYWLEFGANESRLLEPVQSSSAEPDFTVVFRDTLHYEIDSDYYEGDTDSEIQDSYVVSGETWFWKMIRQGSSATINFDVPALDLIADSLWMDIKFRGITYSPEPMDHHLQIAVNGTVVQDLYFNDRQEKRERFSVPVSILTENDNQLLLTSVDDLGATISEFYVDWFELIYDKKFSTDEHFLKIDLQIPQSDFGVNGFTSNDIGVWDVENTLAIKPYSTSQSWVAQISAYSAGGNDGNSARILINDQVYNQIGTGYLVVVLDSQTGALVQQKSFDLYNFSDQSDSLRIFIENVDAGDIVIVAVRDEGASNLSDDTFAAFQQIGGAVRDKIGYRESYAIIGRKGAAQGTAVEQLSPRYAGPVSINNTVLFEQGGDSFAAIFSTTGTRNVIVFDYENYLTPQIEFVENSTLLNESMGADYLIITHKHFQEQAERLSDYRESQNGFRSRVVYVDDIYNEFNHGVKHVQAVKDFLKYAYENWPKPAPLYLLLLGDTSWDPKMLLADAEHVDFVPSFGNPVSDTWLVLLDSANDLTPDMHVGRIPAINAEQAEQFIDKMIAYESCPSAAWKKQLGFITGGFDDYERINFVAQSNDLIHTFVEPAPFYGTATLIDKKTDVEGENRDAIIDMINSGVLWINFIGHAGSRTWDLMFHNPDIFALNNSPYYPFISSMTCHTGRYGEPNQTSFGEEFLLAPELGAVSFLGTSGWGYVYEDKVLLNALFKTVTQDTTVFLGKALDDAKNVLTEKVGVGFQSRNMIYQYNLMGDPALTLAFPTKPDYAITNNDFAINPLLPSEADSIAQIKLTISNWGLISQDSVDVQLTISHPQNSDLVLSQRIAPIPQADSLIFQVPLNNLAGEVTAEVSIDPLTKIPEIDDENNVRQFLFSVLSSDINLVTPQNHALLSTDEVVLKIENPQINLDGINFEFQLDTTLSFNSPLFQSSGFLEPGRFITKWIPQNLKENQHYFWRARSSADASTFAFEAQFTTNNNGEFGWLQNQQSELNAMNLANTVSGSNGVELAKTTSDFTVQSAGLTDGRYAVINMNGSPVMSTGFGHNVVVINHKTGQVEKSGVYFLWNQPGLADTLAAFINAVPDSFIVISAINDEGRNNLNEAAIQAYESVGSSQIRNLEYRSSWLIFGQKGASIGSVPEFLSSQGYGAVEFDTTLTWYESTGQFDSGWVGPTSLFNSAYLDQTTPSGSQITTNWFGKKADGKIDTVSNNQEEFTFSDLGQYRYLKCSINLSSQDRRYSPFIHSLKFLYEPVADLASSPHYFTLSADSVLVGDTVTINLEIFNIGSIPTENFSVTFLENDDLTGQLKLDEKNITNSVDVDSSTILPFTWSSVGKQGMQKLYVQIDSENVIPELSEINNSLIASVYVKADTVPPTVDVTFDGVNINYDDLVSTTPQIIAKIFDNSPGNLVDTTFVTVNLDGKRVSFLNNETIINLQQATDEAQAELIYQPTLEDGFHTLEIFVQDASGNTIYNRSDFKVIGRLALMDVMNYPNPFPDETEFTFVLTQPADVQIKIFTVAGRLIKNFEPNFQPAGFNMIHWDGRDQDGDEIANGVYIYKVMAKSDDKKLEKTSKLIKIN